MDFQQRQVLEYLKEESDSNFVLVVEACTGDGVALLPGLYVVD